MTASCSYGSFTKLRGGRVNKELFFGGSDVSLEFDSSISMSVCSLFKSLKFVDCLFVFTFLSRFLCESIISSRQFSWLKVPSKNLIFLRFKYL